MEERQRALADGEAVRRAAGLWKDRPVPAGELEPAPERVWESRPLAGGRVTAARVRGKKHRHDGTGCDDWYEISRAGKFICAAVSDGAGSKRLSRVGARTSCRTAAASMAALLERDFACRPELWRQLGLPAGDSRCAAVWGALAEIVQKSVLLAGEAVESAWRARARDPAYAALLGREPEIDDFAGTLLAAALVPLGDGACLAAVCQIGDGAAALLDTRTGPVPSVRLLGEADAGAFAGETAFLTSPQMRRLEALQSRTRIAQGTADTLFLMTDGVSDDYFPPSQGMGTLYRDLAAAGVLNGEGPEDGRRLLEWLEGYTARGSFDDRTLVIARL